MTPLEIKIAMMRNRVTGAEIARRLDPPPTRVAVYRVINREFVSARIMEAIADAIGRDKRIVFPEYFGRDSIH